MTSKWRFLLLLPHCTLLSKGMQFSRAFAEALCILSACFHSYASAALPKTNPLSTQSHLQHRSQRDYGSKPLLRKPIHCSHSTRILCVDNCFSSPILRSCRSRPQFICSLSCWFWFCTSQFTKVVFHPRWQSYTIIYLCPSGQSLRILSPYWLECKIACDHSLCDGKIWTWTFITILLFAYLWTNSLLLAAELYFEVIKTSCLSAFSVL